MSNIQTQNRAVATVQQLLIAHKDQIQMALPKHLTPERMIRIALTAMNANSKLKECSPLSICGAVVEASILGLEPNGVLAEAYLVPYNGVCKLQIGYQGMLRLIYNTGELTGLYVAAVHEGDDFEIENGFEPHFRHKHAHLTEEQRGGVIGYVAALSTRGGLKAVEYWPTDRVNAHRDKFSKAANSQKKDNPWITNYDAMAKKTVLRAAMKYLPKSSTIVQRAMALDEYGEQGLPQVFSPEVPEVFQPTIEAEVVDIQMPEEDTNA